MAGGLRCSLSLEDSVAGGLASLLSVNRKLDKYGTDVNSGTADEGDDTSGHPAKPCDEDHDQDITQSPDSAGRGESDWGRVDRGRETVTAHSLTGRNGRPVGSDQKQGSEARAGVYPGLARTVYVVTLSPACTRTETKHVSCDS